MPCCYSTQQVEYEPSERTYSPNLNHLEIHLLEKPIGDQYPISTSQSETGSFCTEKTPNMYEETLHKEMDLDVPKVISSTTRDFFGFRVNSSQLACATMSQIFQEFELKDRILAKEWDSIMTSLHMKPISNRELKALIRKRGISMKRRTQIWPFLLNALDAMTTDESAYRKLCDLEPPKDVSEQIEKDLLRTYPTHKHFCHEGAKINALRRLLRAFSFYDPEIGYCQSLNFISAGFLIVLDEELAFWSLVSIVSGGRAVASIDIRTYFTPNMTGIRRDMLVLQKLLSRKLPVLSHKIIEFGLSMEILCTAWFLTLFSSAFPFEITLRVWDCLFCEGDKILFRFAIGFFILHQKELLRCSDMEELVSRIKDLAATSTDPDAILENSFSRLSIGSLPKAKIQKLRQEVEKVLTQR
eukprot:GHVP01060072.1.p1 GENE.GHVP01060072.1~~GHVP01060072.1.p1  ORF type:complete len:413 (+),score=73.64 GHVP01060072.1:41-1279(+)